MNPYERFMAYAVDFEKTYVDDDWSRLEKYFAEDAIYSVTSSPAYSCRLEGRDSILRGIRKSVDGFDRKCERSIEVVGEPEIGEDRVTLAWAVSYSRPGAPTLRLPGKSTAEYADGVIARLSDDYADADEQAMKTWLREHGADLDPSYV